MILYQRQWSKDMGDGKVMSRRLTVDMHGFTNLCMIGAELPFGWHGQVVNVYLTVFRVSIDWR